MRSGLKHFPVMDWGAADTLGRRFVAGSLGCRRPFLNLVMGWVLSVLIICAWQQCQAQTNLSVLDVRFDALSMIESGDCDSCRGKDGEVSRFQIMPAVWTNEVQVYPIEFARHWNISRFAAFVIQRHRSDSFISNHHRPPTDVEWYLLWHRPARVMNPTSRELERANRFSNLCERMRHEHN